ncbi:MAG: hypothetical protein FWC54_06625 [Actinomycetia bacterium]|nr:hypothetical protein [Actinomycetes bacterium]
MFSCTELLRDERGQALTEAPVVIVTLCLLILILFQPVVTLYTKMVLGAAAASLCRVVATDTTSSSGEDAAAGGRLLQTYAEGKIAGLPRGSAFQVPGSLRLEVSGDAYAAEVHVRLSVSQKTLPLLGLLVGARRDGTVEIAAEARSVGALAGIGQGADYEYPPLGQNP